MPAAELRGISVVRGHELATPKDYLPMTAMKLHRDACIVCMEFADGQIMPLTLTDAAFKLDYSEKFGVFARHVNKHWGLAARRTLWGRLRESFF
jgi:hypothetical protein